jgi:hypothetical protein
VIKALEVGADDVALGVRVGLGVPGVGVAFGVADGVVDVVAVGVVLVEPAESPLGVLVGLGVRVGLGV